MSKDKPVRRNDLIGMEPHNEVCLVRVEEDGTLRLDHLQIDLHTADGSYQGSIVYNGWIELPKTRFVWADDQRRTGEEEESR